MEPRSSPIIRLPPSPRSGSVRTSSSSSSAPAPAPAFTPAPSFSSPSRSPQKRVQHQTKTIPEEDIATEETREYIQECTRLKVDPIVEVVLCLNDPNVRMCRIASRKQGIFDADAVCLRKVLKGNKSIETLRFEDCDLNAASISTILTGLSENISITALHIISNRVDSEFAARLGDFFKINTRIMELRMDDCRITDENISLLVSGWRENHVLQKIGLQKNAITVVGCRSLAHYLKGDPGLKELNLRFNRFGDDGVMALGTALPLNNHLTTLDLGSTEVGDEGAMDLFGQLAVNQTLLVLNLRSNRLGDPAAKEIAKYLEQSPNLQELFLGGNYMTEDAFISLLRAVAKNKVLRRLDLQNIPLGSVGLGVLSETLIVNASLSEIIVDVIHPSARDAAELANAVRENPTLKRFVSGKLDSTTSRAIEDSIAINRFIAGHYVTEGEDPKEDNDFLKDPMNRRDPTPVPIRSAEEASELQSKIEERLRFTSEKLRDSRLPPWRQKMLRDSFDLHRQASQTLLDLHTPTSSTAPPLAFAPSSSSTTAPKPTRPSVPKPSGASRESRSSSGGDSSSNPPDMSLEEALRELEIERRHAKNAEVMLREEIMRADKDKSEERKRYVELQFRAEADRKASEDAQKKLEMATSKVAYFEELSKKNERDIQKYEDSIRELEREREELRQGIRANEREAALAMERIADAEARAEEMDLAAGERERIQIELQKERQIADELKALHSRGEAKMKEQARVIAELKHNLDAKNRNATELETQLKDERSKAAHHKHRHEQLDSEFTEQQKKIEILTSTIEGQKASDLSRERELSRQLQVEFERQESMSQRLVDVTQRQQEKIVALERAFSGMESRFESQISLEKERYANLEREFKLEKGETERLRSYVQERFGEFGELREEITARFSEESQRVDSATQRLADDISSRHSELARAIEDMAKGLGDESVRRLEEHRVDMEEYVETRLGEMRKEYEQLHESVVSDLKTLMEAIHKLGRLKDEVKEDVAQCVRGLRELDDKILGVQKESSQALIKAGEDISSIGRSLRNTESSLQQFADSFDRRLRETVSELRINISEVDSNGRKSVDDAYNRVTREYRREMTTTVSQELGKLRRNVEENIAKKIAESEEGMAGLLQKELDEHFSEMQEEQEEKMKLIRSDVEKLTEESRFILEESAQSRVDEESRLREQLMELRSHVDHELEQGLERGPLAVLSQRLEDTEARIRTEDRSKWAVADVRLSAMHEKVHTVERTVRALQRALDAFHMDSSRVADSSSASASLSRSSRLASSSLSSRPHSSSAQQQRSGIHDVDELSGRMSALEDTFKKDSAASLLALESLLGDRLGSSSMRSAATQSSKKTPPSHQSPLSRSTMY